MRKFEVKIKEVHIQIIPVEAENSSDAVDKVAKILETGVLPDGSNLPNEVEYSYTMDTDSWEAWEA